MKKCFSLFFIGLANICFSQIKDFAFQKEIINGVEGWNKIQLADEMYSKVNPSLTDIRIYGITSSPKNDTLEMPYVLETGVLREKKNTDFKIINQYNLDNRTHFIIQPIAATEIDYLSLSFAENNFDWKVSIRGSDDKVNWKPIIADARIMSIQNSNAHFSYTDVDFPLSSYKYFEVVVNDDDCHLNAAQIKKKAVSSDISKSYDIANVTKVETKQKETVLHFSLANAVPINQVRFEVAAPKQYQRPITIAYLYDSVATEKGLLYQYRDLYQGRISSLDDQQIVFPNTIAQHFEVKIYNEDNQPLSIFLKSVSGIPYYLLANFTKADQYFICYGNDTINAASYDLKYFVNQAGVRYNLVTLSETITKNKVVAKTPQDRNKKLLWVVIVATVLLLGAFTIKMLKEK